MKDLLNSIVETPIPVIFILFGLFLLLLSLGIKITTTIITSNVNPKHSGILGSIFLILGIALYSFPFIVNSIGKNKSIITNNNTTIYKSTNTNDLIYDYKINLYVGRTTKDSDLLNKKIIVNPDKNITYRVDYENTPVSSGLPKGVKSIVEYDSDKLSIVWLPTNCKKENNKIICDLFTLKPGTSHTLYYVAKISKNAKGVLKNTVRIYNNKNDINNGNDSSSAVVVIEDNITSEKIFYNTGELHWEINYINNKRNGAAIEYFKNKKIKQKWIYKNNILNGKYIIYYDNGSVKEEGSYSRGKLDKELRQYYKNGNIKSIYNYQDGNVTGTYKKYTKDGVMTKGIISKKQ